MLASLDYSPILELQEPLYSRRKPLSKPCLHISFQNNGLNNLRGISNKSNIAKAGPPLLPIKMLAPELSPLLLHQDASFRIISFASSWHVNPTPALLEFMSQDPSVLIVLKKQNLDPGEKQNGEVYPPPQTLIKKGAQKDSNDSLDHSKGGNEEDDDLEVVKRKDSKEKIVFKFQRRKKRAELDRLKKSYLKELEKLNKSNQLSEADRQLEVERVGLEEEARKLSQGKEANEMGKYAKADQIMEVGPVPVQKLCEKELDAEELERRIKQRKEDEETYRFAWRLGIKGGLPEEEMIQFFYNKLEEKYVERINGK